MYKEVVWYIYMLRGWSGANTFKITFCVYANLNVHITFTCYFLHACMNTHIINAHIFGYSIKGDVAVAFVFDVCVKLYVKKVSIDFSAAK